jgi:hypothetical protein
VGGIPSNHNTRRRRGGVGSLLITLPGAKVEGGIPSDHITRRRYAAAGASSSGVLQVRQKSPVSPPKEPCITGITSPKEPCIAHKRALYHLQTSPANACGAQGCVEVGEYLAAARDMARRYGLRQVWSSGNVIRRDPPLYLCA